MSAFLAAAYPDSIQILTDGAVYTPEGILLKTHEKVRRSDTLPMAVCHHGSAATIPPILTAIDKLAALSGSFDGVIFLAQRVVSAMRERIEFSDQMHAGVCIAGFSETSGPSIFYFCTSDAMGIEPFKLVNVGGFFGAGPLPTEDEFEVIGLTPEKVEALGSRLFHEHGADMMEVMRGKPGTNPTMPDRPPIYGVGGHVDLTTITTDNVSTARLRTWPDVIGQMIIPFPDEISAAA